MSSPVLGVENREINMTLSFEKTPRLWERQIHYFIVW